MIKVETERNIIESSSDTLPPYACNGTCKKTWWTEDLNNQDNTILHVLVCPACNGPLIKAIEGTHFKVIKKAKGNIVTDGSYTARYASTLKDGFELI